MKTTLACLFLFASVLFSSTFGHAQCSTTSNPCVTGISLGASSILGDGKQIAEGTITAYLPSGFHPGAPGFLLEMWSAGTAVQYNCVPGAVDTPGNGTGFGYQGGCRLPDVEGPRSVTIHAVFYGTNYTSSTINSTVYARAGYTTDTPLSQPLDIDPVVQPGIGPDLVCIECSSGGNPINFANGNTWIAEQDYSIPGLGGGMALTRTWNSLWQSVSPPEQVGIFGDSWRSNFEERIESLTGGVVKYWKGNGNVLIYSYNSGSSTYAMTSPPNDQTTISYDSMTTEWTVTEKGGTVRTFNSAGYLTAITDRNGNTISISVDSSHQNRIASVTDAASRTLTFNYANSSYPRLCTSISDTTGTVASYTYDSSSRLTQVQYADGSQYNFTYDSSDLILDVADSNSVTLEAHTYDSQRRGRTSAQANDVNKVSAYYYSGGLSTSVTNSNNAGGTLTFSLVGGRRFLVDASAGVHPCATCLFEAGAFSKISATTGDHITSTDPNGNRSYFTYDSQGNMLSKMSPTGNLYTNITGYNTWSYSYNSFGEVLTATDPLGHVTANVYDSHGNLTSTTTPSPDGGTTAASVTSFTYDSAGQLLTITDPLSHTTTLAYYSNGLIHTITDHQSHVTTHAYDARGNRTSVTDAASHTTSFTYDSMNRLTQITYPDSSTVQFAYDIRGRRTSVTDQNGKVTSYAYDDADRLTSVTDAQTPTHGVTSYTYDGESNLTDIYDAASNHTHFTYFSDNTFFKTTFPSGQYETYIWDGTSQNLQYKTDRKGQQIVYWLDYQNRLFKKFYPDGSTVNYTYDDAGRLTQVQDKDPYGSVKTGTYGFTYDDMGRLTQTSTDYSFDSAGAYTVQYGYDAASNRTSMTDPQSGSTSYSYDSLNRLTNLQDPSSNSIGFSYDSLSRRTQLTRPNGINTNYSYDSLSRLLSVLHQSGSTTLDGASYTYDNAGNRTAKTDHLASVTSNYTYDALYQLTGVSQGTTTTESYSYDAVGNRLSSLGMSSYTYNSSNQLTADTNASYTYDYNGNTTSKTDSSGTTYYTWDYENRLTQVTLPSSATVTFKYDPFGRRVQKSSSSGTVNYLYDGANVIEEVNSSGGVLARYTQGPEVDEPFAEVRASTASYYETDGINSVTSLSNSAGTLANTYTYNTFGVQVSASGSIDNSFRYAARDFDSESGVYYNRARYYDENLGRFLSEDPLIIYWGVNHYSYAGNRPASLYDPWGLMGWVYNVTRRNHGWGVLNPGETRTDLPPDIRVDCKCIGKNQYKATVTVSFDITIWFGTQGQLKHENGHLQILQDYLSGRTQHYADTYERIYASKQQCLDAEKGIFKDLVSDWSQINKLQEAHDDWFQNAWYWMVSKF